MVIWTASATPNDYNYVDYESLGSGVDFFMGNESSESSFFNVKVDSPDVDLIYPIEDPIDPSQNPNNIIDFEIPDNINNSIIYDPETDDYLFNSTVGEDFDYRNPSFMTQDEFFEYNLEQSLSDYWEDQVAEEDLDQSSLIPELNVGGKKFQDIFGSNKINIQPQGSAELRFGLNISKTDNPQLPERQRRITTFDFDEKIQLNVTGQIGEKLKLQTSYNTEATFDFENQMKLEYTGFEDEIIKKIEAGNVSLPLSGSLIQGGSSLFGIKTQLQFGRATITSIFSQQKGERKEISVAGGAQISEFELSADKYEANKHYFLNYYHRNNYDYAMKSLPMVNSGVQITRIEVWVTNRTNDYTDTRNIIAFTDLGENGNIEFASNYGSSVADDLPRNNANGLYDYITANPNVRGFVNASSALSSGTYPMQQAVHYEKLENARMLLPTEYTYNAQLGFISLNQSLNNDEVLSVAYQYTHQGNTYQVGEFSTDGITGTNALYLKLLKSTVTSPVRKLWDLMMKNVYSIGAYQVSQKNFRLDVWYNNPTTSVDVNFIPKPGVDGIPLVRMVGLDRYNAQQMDNPDGVFDFVPLTDQNGKIQNGGTINTRNGRVYFTTVEPFGYHLNKELIGYGIDTNTRSQIVYQALYDSTQTAARQIPELNRYKLKGTYESSSSSEIALNAFNIPRGSVQVTAGGSTLTEGQDYTVDYNLGRVKILNDGILSSGTPIKISLESNSLFSIQSKTLMGTHMDYRVNKDFNLGATVMNLTERPLTQKVNQGDEPISNTIFGLNGDFRKKVPYLTKLIDKIPGINTKKKSSVSFSGEAAYLMPGFNRAIGDEGTSYIDDFEGSQSAIDIRSFTSWVPASIPQGQTSLFPESVFTDDLRSGMNRAKLAWYVIDPLFHNDNSLTPDNISGNTEIVDDHRQRRVLMEELFPNKDLGTGQPTFIGMFDMAFYPDERGIYNYDDGSYAAGINGTSGKLNDPNSRWSGIMRSLTTNDFEAANVQYIQFWIMDPFTPDGAGHPNASNVDSKNHSGGDFYINIGNISEDIIKDGAKSFENGNSTSGSFDTTIVRETNLARVPTTQVIVNAFDNDLAARPNQDIGLDGMKDIDEQTFYTSFVSYVSGLGLSTSLESEIINDPSGDNYTYYRDDNYDALGYDILKRYKKYNGHDGNSPTTDMSASQNADGYPTSATTLPNVEDINQDNNLNEAEAYFQYHIDLRPQNLVVGQNYITDKVSGTYTNGTTTKQVNWYQFKIPIASPSARINGIQDFRSIRFIRMFMKNFDEELIMRFGRLELIRGEWRTYLRDLWTPGDYIQDEESGTTFNIGAVNIEENDNYIVPPGINRQVNVQTQNLARLNEQSMVLEVCNLKDGDARAAFRNTSFDVLSYKKLRMFIHAHESDVSKPLNDNDVTCFIRLGTDFENNYYEYEVPIKVSPLNTGVPDEVWPEANNVVIDFSMLRGLKISRPGGLASGGTTPYVVPDPDDPSRRITIVGNPSLAGIKTIMIGVRNPWKDDPTHQWQPDDGLEKCAEVWVNELRLTDFDDFGGWAAQGRVTAQLADFANVAMSGGISTPGFGSIEKRISERQRETIKSFDASATIQLGKFFGDKSGVSLPMYVGYGDMIIDPMFDPLNPDILMKNLPQDELKRARGISRDYTQRKSINFTNVRIDRKREGAKPHFWDIGNWTYSLSYNQTYKRNINTEFNTFKVYNTSLNYSYNPNSKPWKPFSKIKFIRKSKWLRLLKDFNLNPKPKSVSIRTNIDRSYNESQIRGNYNALTIPQFYKTFNWNRGYDLKYDITKALKVDFSANNTAIITENETWVNKEWYPDEYKNFKDSVTQSLRNWGTTMQYGHGLNVSYQLPLNKFPLTDWINVSTKYSVAYDWARAPLAQTELGNTIQNSRRVNWNGQANLVNLYNKIPYFKKVNRKYGRQGRNASSRARGKAPAVSKPGGKGDDDDKKESNFNIFEQGARVIMMLKNVNLTYSTTDGVLLPGYTPSTNVIGMSPGFDAPGLDFVMGGYQRYDLLGDTTGNDFAQFVADNNWMIRDSNSQRLNTQYTTNHAENITGKATIEPIGGIRIDLNINRNLSVNTTDNFRWNDSLLLYQHQNPVETGTFSTSILTWKTAFESDTSNTSEIFSDLRDFRTSVSQLLSDQNDNSVGTHTEDAGYSDGYGAGQQDVILGSFIAAYTGKDPSKKSINPFSIIPLPNWRITIDGISRIPFMKKIFKSITFSHAYKSSFTIGSFTTNLSSATDPTNGQITARDASGNFIAEKQIMTASIMEQFAPLLNFDATLHNSLILKAEFKKDRNVSLSMANNQITEIKGNEFVIGSGYRFDNVELPFKIGGKKPVSNLNVRVDVSIRGNKTITRKIIENQNQVTAGQRLISIKCTADYKLGKALSVRAYFDRIVTTPYISTSFPTANTNAGLALRFTLQ